MRTSIVAVCAVLAVAPAYAAVNSKTTENVSFDECNYLKDKIIRQFNVSAINIVPIVNTSMITTTRICLDKGSVLWTCSAPDRKLIMTESDGRGGCPSR